jgi:hypothetical protein
VPERNKKYSDSACKEGRSRVTVSGKKQKYSDSLWKDIRNILTVSGKKKEV